MNRKVVLPLVLVCAFAVSAGATNVTIGTGGRVTLELLGADAAFRNTMSVVSPAATIAISGCVLEPADGLGGVRLLSERLSQRGCRVDLDSDSGTPGIQGFGAGTTFELSMCAQTDADAPCEYIWSSDPAHNSDGFDHLRVTTIVPGQVFQLNWEDFPGGGDNDFNDLIAVLRVVQDSDGDGLWDDWETSGIDTDGDGVIDLNLPALGANPNHKDIFLEIDWMDCAVAGGDCAGGDTHSHRPINAAVTAVVNAFAAAPVTNPDGVNGVTLHVDVSNSFAHQNFLHIPGACLGAAVPGGSFDAIKADPANFGPDNPRRFAYHYALFTHQQSAGNTSSGCGELPGNDFQVALGGWNLFCAGGPNSGSNCLVNTDCPSSTCQRFDVDGDGVVDGDIGTAQQQAGTLMHELGHNLNLQHGGGDGVNFKPNYLSVMNYFFQMGIPPVARLDYSVSALASLTETNLSEPAGIGDGLNQTTYFCPGLANTRTVAGNAAIDWNCDGDSVDLGVNADVNADGVCVAPGANNTRDTVPAGDDVLTPNGRFILTGPNHTCDTAKAGDDVQRMTVGSSEASPLTGFADWPAILYEFQSTASFDDGTHVSSDPEPELTFKQFSESIAPDIELRMSAAPAVVVTGSNVTYSIVVHNTHPADAHNVTVTDVLPASVSFVGCSATGGGMCGGAGNNRSATFVLVPGGASYVVTIIATVPCSLPDGNTITNSASSATMPDSDPSNNSASATITTSDPPPVISNVSVNKPQLWPPNHKMVDVTVSYTLTDNCPLSQIARSLSVSSNEPENGTGDGDASPDWQVIDANTVRLRAERAGGGGGRTYTITIKATDAGGSTSTATTTVNVPH